MERKSSPFLEMLGRTASAIGVCVLCAYFGVQAAYPFVQAGRLRTENDLTEKQIQDYKFKTQQIEREIKSFDTPQGIETQGRKQGYLKPGEKRLHIPQN